MEFQLQAEIAEAEAERLVYEEAETVWRTFKEEDFRGKQGQSQHRDELSLTKQPQDPTVKSSSTAIEKRFPPSDSETPKVHFVTSPPVQDKFFERLTEAQSSRLC